MLTILNSSPKNKADNITRYNFQEEQKAYKTMSPFNAKIMTAQQINLEVQCHKQSLKGRKKDSPSHLFEPKEKELPLL